MGGLSAAVPPQTALDFPANATAASDIRILWNGANLLPRADHTVIIRARPKSQTGYYSWLWHSPNTGTWDSGAYSFGTHPYPCDGGYDGSGYQTGGTGEAGTDHYYEIAGVGAPADKIAIPMEPATQVNKSGVWVTHVRTCETTGGNLRHRMWPDFSSDPSRYVETTITTGSLGSAGGAPAFYLGCSDWRAGIPSAGQNDECVSALVRGIRLYNACLSSADITAEINAINTNTTGSSGGASAVWYINDSPTPSDVSDKSGAGHSPSWANANRPGLWTG